jgi:hypothetical protein
MKCLNIRDNYKTNQRREKKSLEFETFSAFSHATMKKFFEIFINHENSNGEEKNELFAFRAHKKSGVDAQLYARKNINIWFNSSSFLFDRLMLTRAGAWEIFGWSRD